MRFVSYEATAEPVRELIEPDDDEPQAVRRQDRPAPIVIDPALLAAGNAAHRYPVRLIEVGDGLAVLPLVIFDRQPKRFIEGVDWQTHAPSRWPGIAPKEIEPLLTLGAKAKDVVAEIDDVGLVSQECCFPSVSRSIKIDFKTTSVLGSKPLILKW